MTSPETTDHSARMRFGAGLLIALLVITAAGKTVLFDTLDPDCFWHLRVADQLTREGIHPLIDQISFASIKQPWTPYSWLAELTMKAIWDHLGIRGAIASEAILIAAFFTFIALAAIERSGKRFTSCLLTFLAILLCLPYLSFRPVLMSLTLLAVCWWLLLRDQKIGDSHRFPKGGKWWLSPFSAVWLVVPITAININLHFFAVFAPVWVGCLLISNRRYLWLFLATSLACLATPMLPGVIATVLHYQFADPMLHANVIAEFAPFYHGYLGMTIAIVLLALLAFAIRHYRAISNGEWIALLISFALLLKLGRFAPLFAIVAIPLLSVTAPTLRDRVLGKKLVVVALSICVPLALMKVILGLPLASASPDQWVNRHGPDVPGYPVDAATFVSRNIAPQTHHLLNEFTWGGYLAWRLGDRYQVLMDGRTQLYAPAFWQAIYLDRSITLTKTLNRFSADAAVLPTSHSRLHDPLIALGWRSAYRDPRAEVLVPPDSPLVSIDEK